MALDPKVRDVGLHVGTALTTATAMALWFSSHSVDLYAIMDQFNVVVKDIAKLMSTVGVFATAAAAAWKATQKESAKDVAATGAMVVTSPAIAAATPEQPNIVSSASVAVVPK